MKRTSQLATLLGLGISTSAYAGLDDSDMVPVTHSVQELKSPVVTPTIEPTLNQSQQTGEGQLNLEDAESQDYIQPSTECESWMDENVSDVQQRYCIDTSNSNLDSTYVAPVCGEESMQPWLDKTFAGKASNLIDFNNYSCQEIDLETFSGVAIKGFCLDNPSNSYLCINDLESSVESVLEVQVAETSSDNQAPLVTLLAGDFSQVYNSGKSNNYIFEVSDPEGDSWTVKSDYNPLSDVHNIIDLEHSISDKKYVVVPIQANEFEVGTYQICLTATDERGAESSTLCSDYTLNSAPEVVGTQIEPVIPTTRPQSINLSVGYSAMFQEDFNQQSQGILITAAFPLANGLKLVPGIRYGVLMGGNAQSSTTENFDPVINDSGYNHIETLPDGSGDIYLNWEETVTTSASTSYTDASNGHDLQAQLYLGLPFPTKQFENFSLSAAFQVGVYAGKTWGQSTEAETVTTNEYRTESELILRDNQGNEELFQSEDPVFDTQEDVTNSTESLNGYAYGGLGVRLLSDMTLNNGLGIYGQLDGGLRVGSQGLSTDYGFGAGLVYKFPVNKEGQE